MGYLWEVIKRVNKKEDENKEQKITAHTRLVKLLSLRNTQTSQSDPRLAWIIFQNITAIYRDLKQ